MKDINLLPEEIKIAPETPNRGKFMISPKIIIIVFTILVLVVISLMAPKILMMNLEAKTERLRNELNSDEYSRLRSLKDNILIAERNLNLKKDTVKQIQNKSYPITDILNTIKQSIPKDCLISSLEYNHPNIKVKGKATNVESAYTFLANIYRLEYFSPSGASDSVKFSEKDIGYSFDFTFALGRKDGK